MSHSKFVRTISDHLKSKQILTFLLFTLGLQFILLAFVQGGRAVEIFVSTNGSDAAKGTISDSLLTIGQGLNSAEPGDTVFLRGGTYHEKIVFPTGGTENKRIVLSSYENETVLIQQTGRVMDVDKPYITVSGLTLDGGWGDTDIVVLRGTADYAIFKDLEIRNGRRDGIDIRDPEGVLIDGCRIHDMIWFDDGDRFDAHGIVTEGVQDLTIRNTEIYYVSGDALQFQYEGWDNIRLENCTLWNGPLPTARGGADAGVKPGENAVDTKYRIEDGRGHLYIQNTLAYGWRSNIIDNASAFNIKHNVETVFDGVTVHDSDIAFRLRGPVSRGGAWVTIKNTVVFDSNKAVRYEDDIENLHIYNMTFGNEIGRFFESAGGHGDGFQVLNCLFLSSNLPNEAADASNLAVGADSFKNISANDYHLSPDSRAIDVGVPISEVSVDLDGDPRPIGQGYDVGADEYNNSQSNVIISGYTLDASGIPLPDVAIRSGNNTVATTDEAGQYSISVESGWSGTLTPLKAGYSFLPTNRSFSNVVAAATDQDFAGEIMVYQISGHVVDPDGQPLAGAVIRSSDGGQAATNDQGFYSVSVPHGWNGILTPEKTGFNFIPENRSYQNVETPKTDQDYSAIAKEFTLSGSVLDATGSPVSDVAIRSGNHTVATTDEAGQYSVSVESGWSGTLTPLKAGYSFVPTNRSFSDVVTAATNQDFTAEINVHQISGHVVDPDGQFMAGIVVRSSDGDQAVTDTQGVYSMPVPHGWDGVLTPEETGFNFTPENRSYQNVETPKTDQDYSAVAERFTLSGRVQDASGNGISEVEIRVNDNALASTDNAGNFSFDVPFEWSGQLVPSKAGYIFTPASRSYENVTSDQSNIAFEGRKEKHTISGQIQDADGTGIPEAEIFSDGQLLGNSDAEGAYLLELEAGWSGTLTPKKEGFDFEPPNRTINNLTANQTDQNFIGELKDFTISGRILYPDGNPIPETTVSVEGASEIVTDSAGLFSISVKYGWAGTVTPEKKDLTFTPPNRSYSDVSNDFVDQIFTGTERPINLGQAIAVLKIISEIPVPGMDLASLEWIEDGRVDLKDALYILRIISY